MTQSARTTVKCQDPGDGSGDVIVELPPDILKELRLAVGDKLSIEIFESVIVLRPIRDPNPG
ncbi:AbrB/MazE/SpoVT family DNA-binding domain-containing protein [Pseudomonas mosselii]|uniref:AbrB/MazE/SpoVT family DNA-binding domain-containing protein n=1 Tax=unclassified Pseudomonas TaxID=196821 RepID=UPI0020C43A24|nr:MULTISPECIES: AbrB/MazE/SpoVT family DNA-binding domain-containing protein [unclassified Pseudomonas]MCP8632931.1 AbrB/MazE/SpoVT family DNA-binding domain-containing protein [Pseudomonas sp. DVZ6]MDD7783358.1 AbrB/MazE/SpoVT family DNA-binding domain-containing protein [Pseudomonas sp. DVZ24]